MQDSSAFVSLHEAMEQALRAEGSNLLRDPQRLVAFVRDLADNSLPEVRLFMHQVDLDLIDPLSQITDTSDKAELRIIASKIAQILIDDRFVDKSLARKTANELVAGVAAFWGASYALPEVAEDSSSSPASSAQTIAVVPETQESQQTDHTASRTQAQQAQTATQPSVVQAQHTAQPQQQTVYQNQPQAIPQYTTQTQVQTTQVPPTPQNNKGSKAKVVAAVLITLAIVGAGIFAYVTFGSKLGLPGTSSRSTSAASAVLLRTVDIPDMSKMSGVRTLNQTENGITFDWILFGNANDDSATSVLYITNDTSGYKDVDLSFHFQDLTDKDVNTEDVSITSLAPHETTCVYASGAPGTVDSSYNYTVYDARTPNSRSLGECITYQIVKQDSSGLIVRLTNVGSTTAHLSKAYVFGTNKTTAAQWSSSTWLDNEGNELPGLLEPNESTEITFEEGLWDSVDVEVFPIGYADAP